MKHCAIPIDLILVSSDGQRFGAHKFNLQEYGDGFPYAESVTATDVKEDCPVLQENGAVLCLMLQFMHHAPQPELDDLPFDTVALLSDAVEKYFIYSAMGLCKKFME